MDIWIDEIFSRNGQKILGFSIDPDNTCRGRILVGRRDPTTLHLMKPPRKITDADLTSAMIAISQWYTRSDILRQKSIIHTCTVYEDHREPLPLISQSPVLFRQRCQLYAI